MKVLHIASWYPNKQFPYEGDFVQRHLKAVAGQWPTNVLYIKKNNAHSIFKHTVSSEKKENLTETIFEYGSLATGIPVLDSFFSILRYQKLVFYFLRNYIKENGKPNVIHVHVAMPAGVAALAIKKTWGIPYVITEHSTMYHKDAIENLDSRPFLWRFMLKKVLQNANMLLPVTDNLGRIMNQIAPATPYCVISNVVDTSLFHLSPMKFHGLFKMIHVSGFTYQKNVEGIINALFLVNQNFDNWQFTFAGYADEKIKKMTTLLGLNEKIKWTGEVVYSEIAELMRANDCLVMFSRFENQPCVILEALCCGLPVITTKKGGISECINEENGLFTTSEDTLQLSKIIIQLKETYQKYNREKIAQQAMAKYNYEIIAAKIISVYSIVLGKA